MKVIIPLAGKGTRLRPHTHITPKPMLKVAGKPVMDYVMEDVAKLGNVDQVIYITGHLKEKVEAHARSEFSISSVFIEQKVQDGTAGAVALAKPYVDAPVLIIFVDTIFDADLSVINTSDADGIIWVKEVEDYQRFGVVVTDADGYMTKIVEKPSEPISKLANIGLYFIRDVEALWAGIDHVLAAPANKGEYYLTDAFQHMIEHGRKIRTAEVGGWYDCGQLETTIETNGILLAQGAARHGAVGPDVTIVEPVLIEPGCTLERCTIGPNVTLEGGTTVRDATVANAIVGPGCTIERSALDQAMLGEKVKVTGFTGSGSFGAHTEVHGA